MDAHAQFDTIHALDLEPIKAKLICPESGEAWSPQQATEAEFEYRRFLCLMKLFPGEQVAPMVAVDTFWHYHILDTMRYAADCEQVFGYFLHHIPSNGPRNQGDTAVHQQSAARMQELYETTFGERYGRAAGAHPIVVRPALAADKTAWCAPGVPERARSAQASEKRAWCAPAAPTAAWCAPGATWPQGAMAIRWACAAAVQNDSSYLQRAAALAA